MVNIFKKDTLDSFEIGSSNPNYLCSTNSSEVGYTKITDIEELSDLYYYEYLLNGIDNCDYAIIRQGIEDIAVATGFSNLTTIQQAIVADFCAYDDNTLVTYYATNFTAGDLVAAIEMHSNKIGEFVANLEKVAHIRIEHPYTKMVVMRYLKDRSQIDLFMAAIRNFISDYKFKFHIGTAYGDSTDGIMDYVENTGGYIDPGTGLDSYEFSDLYKQVWYATNAADPQNPTQIEQDSAHNYVRDLLKVELKNILVYGVTK